MRDFRVWFMYLLVIFAAACQQKQNTGTSADKALPEAEFTASNSGTMTTMYNTEIKHGFDLKLIAYFDTKSELSHTYAQKLSELKAALADESVFYTIVFPKKGETAGDIQNFISRHQLQDVEFYNDPEYLMTNFTGATTMPQFFLLDSLSNPVYHGAFDASGEAGSKGESGPDYLFESIQHYLKGKKPATIRTEPLGQAIRQQEDPA